MLQAEDAAEFARRHAGPGQEQEQLGDPSRRADQRLLVFGAEQHVAHRNRAAGVQAEQVGGRHHPADPPAVEHGQVLAVGGQLVDCLGDVLDLGTLGRGDHEHRGLTFFQGYVIDRVGELSKDTQHPNTVVPPWWRPLGLSEPPAPGKPGPSKP